MPSAIATVLFGLTLRVYALGSDLTGTVAASAQRYIWLGRGDCSPNRPQWVGTGKKKEDCRDVCNGAEACVGYDSDDDTCRVRFLVDADTASPPKGFSSRTTGESITTPVNIYDIFSGTTGGNKGGCYQKNTLQAKNQYMFWGEGNCEPNRPQWFNRGNDVVVSFSNCFDLCDIAGTCIGFDFDNKDKKCRLRFERDEVPSPPAGYIYIYSPQGIGFTGVSGSSSARCFEKVSTLSELEVTRVDCADAGASELEVLKCGKGKITAFTPASIKPGRKTTMIGTVMLSEDVYADGVSFDLELFDWSEKLVRCRGDASTGEKSTLGGGASTKSCDALGAKGSLAFHALNFPLKAGVSFQVKVDIQLSASLRVHPQIKVKVKAKGRPLFTMCISSVDVGSLVTCSKWGKRKDLLV